MTRQERKQKEKRNRRTGMMRYSTGMMHFLGASTGFIHGLWISFGKWVGDIVTNWFNNF